MTVPKNTRRHLVPLALLAAAGTLALTACGTSGTTAGAAGSTATPSSPVSAATAGGGSASGGTAASGGGSASGGTTASGRPIASTNGNASSDSYAYKHLCTADQLNVKVTYDAPLGATKRLIAVTDTGSTACGLSYFPVVAIDAAATIHTNQGTPQTVQPKVPGGLGGAPAYALYAGHTAYAVVDLNPSHSISGAVRTYDQLSVIASDGLPNAATVEAKLVDEGGSTGNPYVKDPFLGLYRNSIADAVSAAKPTNG